MHGFIGEAIEDAATVSALVKKIAHGYKLPYFTISPTYSVCEEHGYFSGEQAVCKYCGKETEVYSRIVGYYRPIKNWNEGKKAEFDKRKTYDRSSGFPCFSKSAETEFCCEAEEEKVISPELISA
jgi:ribonucleoside-triphosphate reductase